MVYQFCNVLLGLRICWLYPFAESKTPPPPKRGVLDMMLNCISLLGFCSSECGVLLKLALLSGCTVSWDCRMHWLHLCRGVRPFPNKCPVYNTKLSDDEVSIMLKLWGMWSTPSLPSLPGPLWSRVVAPDRFLSMGQIELNCVLMLNWIVWNRTILTFDCVWTKTNIDSKLNCLN